MSQRPQIGREHDVGRFLFGVKGGLLGVRNEIHRVGILRRRVIAVLHPEAAVLGEVRFPESRSLRCVLVGDVGGRLGEVQQLDLALGKTCRREREPRADMHAVPPLSLGLFQRLGKGFV